MATERRRGARQAGAGAKRKAPAKEEEQAPPQAPPAGARPAAKRRRGERELLPAAHPSHQQVPGELFAFGAGEDGQLGVGEDDALEFSRPKLIAGITGVVQLAAGGMHSVALMADGSVRTTGVNDEAALGRPTGGKAWAPRGLPEGELGDSYTFLPTRRPQGMGRVLQVSAGDSHTAALTAGGEVWCWGVFRDATGPFGFAPGVAAALEPTRVYTPADEAGHAVKVASGADHVALLTRGGRVWTWGCGNAGQLGRVGAGSILDGERLQQAWLVPAEVPFARARTAADDFAVDIACGTYATAALARSGAVFAWGLNNYGQLGLPLRAAGVVYVPTPVPALAPKGLGGGRQLAGLALGQHHSLGLLSDGGLLSWGRATYGRLGRPKLERGATGAGEGGAAAAAGAAQGAAEGAQLNGHAAAGSGEAAQEGPGAGAAQQPAAVGGGAPTAPEAGAGPATASGGGSGEGKAGSGRAKRKKEEAAGEGGEGDAVDVSGDEPYPVPRPVQWGAGAQGTPVGLTAGLAVSGCWTREGAAFLWGFGTTSQLGNGDAGEDQLTPERLASKRLAGHAVTQVAFGGQHTLVLATAKPANGAAEEPQAGAAPKAAEANGKA